MYRSPQTGSAAVQVEALRQGLIVSCQPVPGGAMDNAAAVVGFARAALDGGARGLRIESIACVRAVRAATNAPIIGIVKEDRSDSPVRITPLVEQAIGLIEAGADIVAFDATRRPRPASVHDLVVAIKSRGVLAMADCADVEDARAALVAGADLVGTTLSGYVGGPVPAGPDFELITAMRKLTPHVMAEGRLHSPADAAEAIRRGAWCVTIGSAITRTEHVTQWFRDAIASATGEPEREVAPVLAIDIGGTKMLAALARGAQISNEAIIPTERTGGPDGWIAAIADRFADCRGQYRAVAAAVTGLASGGRWSALNPATLDIPGDYPLADRLAEIFGAPATIVNDAQAAAWGEYRFGAGQGQDIVFVTISTGVGGGVVLNDRLLPGLAGHFGLLRSPSVDGRAPFENEVSGRWIAAEAAACGHPSDVPAVFAAAHAGEVWAEAILAASARKVALLCQDLQLAFDPGRIVIGGGIGLAAGYLERVRKRLPELGARLRPTLVPAKLGARAGLVGVADIAATAVARGQRI
jgi:N-acetylmannosamine-6-phosphate 2-epimerase/N-acetylmannosamine kinase